MAPWLRGGALAMRVALRIGLPCALFIIFFLPSLQPRRAATAASVIQQKVATRSTGTQVVVTLDTAPTVDNTLVVALTTRSSVGGLAGASGIAHGTSSLERGPSSGGLDEVNAQIWFLGRITSTGTDIT